MGLIVQVKKSEMPYLESLVLGYVNTSSHVPKAPHVAVNGYCSAQTRAQLSLPVASPTNVADWVQLR